MSKWCVLILALGMMAPLCAQTGESCIGPEAVSNYGVIGKPYTGQFVVHPGWLPAGPVTNFIVQEGTNLPPGLTFDGATGVLAGTPTATGTYSIVLRVYLVSSADHYCGIRYPLIVNFPLSLASGGLLPPGNVGAGYLAWVAQNGAPPYTFKVATGTLPPGLSFDATTNALTGTPLAQGAYSFSGTVSDGAGESLSGQYSVVIGPAGDVYLTSASVSLEAVAGAAVQSYPVGVLTTDLKAVQFGASVVAPPGGAAPSWLKVTPTAGSTPAQLSVQADPSKMGQGTTAAQIQVTPQGKNPITLPVTFKVLDSRISFGAAPTGIKVSFPANADLTKAVTTLVQVWNNGGQAVTGAATAQPPAAGPAWVSITPASFTLAPGQVQALAVTVDASKLLSGTHFGMVELKGPNQAVDIPVQLSIVGTVVAPVLTVMPQAVIACFLCDTDKNNGWEDTFGGYYGDDIINVQNPSPDSAYTVSLQGFSDAVQVQPTMGTAGAREQIHVNACQLGLGSHIGYMVVSAPRMTPAKVYQKVEIRVATPLDPNSPPPDPAFTKGCSTVPPPWYYSSGLVMAAQKGQTDPVTAQITVTGSDDQPLQFAVNTGADAPAGVSVFPARGVATSTPTTVTVTADPSKITSGVTQSDSLVVISMGGGWYQRVPSQFAGSLLQLLGGGGGTVTRRDRVDAAAACTPTRMVLAPMNPASYFSQTVDWPLSIQARLVDDCGKVVTDASVTASFSSGDPGLALTLTDQAQGIYGATWRPATAAASLTLTLRALKTGLPVASRAVYGSVLDDVKTPAVTADGVVNGLNPVAGAPVAPGTVAAIFGRNLAPSNSEAAGVPLPTSLGGTQVLVGGIAAPLFFVSPNQIDVQIPSELPANSSQDVIVLAGGNVSIPRTIQLGAVNPGVASYTTGRVIAQHGDYTLVTPNTPARPEEWIVLYLVGMGETSPAVASNQAAPLTPPASAKVQPAVTIDGAAAPVKFAGLTPGAFGLYQINCQVPKGARTGDLPLVIVQGDVAANAATIPVAQ